MLASAPMLLPLIPDGDDIWRLSPAGWRRTLAREWAGCEVTVEGHGSCLAAIAAMHGLALEELTDEELARERSALPGARHDPGAQAMKIVQAVGWYHPDSVGGTEVYVAALAKELRAGGHEVLIAAPDAGLAAPHSYEHDGCEVFRYPIPASPSREEAQGDVAVRGAEHLHRWLAAARADVVHMHTFVTGLGLAEIRAARDAGSRVVVTTHASSLGYICQRGTLMWRGESLCDGIVDASRCAECVLQHRGASPMAGAALASIPAAVGHAAGALPGRLGTALGMTDLIVRNMTRQRAMLDAVDAFVVLTEHAAGIVRANGAPAGKVVVNRLGVSDDADLAAVPARLSHADVNVGYVGRFEDVKGVLDLAEAMRRVPADVRMRLDFRGPAQTAADRDTKAAIIAMLAADPRVTVGDGVEPANVASLLRSYDVLCCPSRCLEGGPTVGLEAMAVGVPVIAASVGGVAEVVEDGVNARLVPPGDVERLAAALVEVASDPSATICQWRTRLPAPRTMRDVARLSVDLQPPELTSDRDRRTQVAPEAGPAEGRTLPPRAQAHDASRRRRALLSRRARRPWRPGRFRSSTSTFRRRRSSRTAASFANAAIRSRSTTGARPSPAARGCRSARSSSRSTTATAAC